MALGSVIKDGTVVNGVEAITADIGTVAGRIVALDLAADRAEVVAGDERPVPTGAIDVYTVPGIWETASKKS